MPRALALVLPVALAALIAVLPSRADAFCGFYVGGAGAKLFNNATQVVLMRDGTRTVLSMANNYQGPPADFAMVVPVPVVLQKENVKTLPQAIFTRLDQLTSPRLVEYWEQDPCPKYGRIGKGGGGVLRSAPTAARKKSADKEMARPAVRIEAQFEVGEYDIVILSADDSLALYDWLKGNGYNIPDGAERVLRPYIASDMKFFVAKVNIQKVKLDNAGRTMLSPLRFHYDSETFSLPIRLGLLNSRGTQDLIVHVLARNQRYEVANYKNVTIPTNIYIRAKTKPRFGEFYASLFDRTVARNPGAVVTEYSWDIAKCDPCPGPGAAFRANEIMTLGGDVIGQGSGPQIATSNPANPAKRRSRRPPRPSWRGWTVTRLHARYTKDNVGEDLVFKAAPAIVGGREFRPSGKRLEQGATSAGSNTFQGRYIIRYKWTGPVTCKNPQWGMWGGPPNRIARGGGAQIAKDVAFVKNRKLPLRNFVLQRVPEIRVNPTWGKRGKAKAKDKAAGQ